MRIRHSSSGGYHKVDLQTTPMIDIVFQLLVFFIMTFKIVSLEGDFNVKMPLAAPSEEPQLDVPLPPIRVRLTAAPDGSISGIQWGQRRLGSFEALRQEVIAFVGTDTGPGSLAEGAEVELDCDYNLNYAYVIDAITHVSGFIERRDGQDQVVRLIENITFAPPRSPTE